jgi:Adenylate and Guanylate cyclase catalytic domain
MTFEEILNQALALLQRQGRVSYRALKRQFGLDDAYLEDLKLEIIEVHQVAVDQNNTMLVWTGSQASASSPAARSVSPQEREPISYTPPHLAEKILTSRSALEGERKQVTVLFCDLANSTALAERLGPERMHTLLNRFFALALDDVHRYSGEVVVRAIGNELHMDYSAVGQTTHLAAQERRYEAQQAFRLLGRLWILEGVFYDVYAGRGIGRERSNRGGA